MRRVYHSRLLLNMIVGFVASCDQTFDPRPTSEPVPIVFSFLANDKAIQYVRLFSSYDPSVTDVFSNTLDNPILNAQVAVYDENNSFVFRDTLLERRDTSRYKSAIHAYASRLTPIRGQRYTLRIYTARFGDLSSTVSFPGQAYPGFSSTSLLDNPTSYLPSARIAVGAGFNHVVKAYVMRLLLDYEVLEGSNWVVGRKEIPVGFRTKGFHLNQSLYGEVKKLESTFASEVYTNGAYQALLADIISRTYPLPIRFKQVMIQIVQIEENLYNYNSVVHGFQDPFSIRLDKPHYSNILNGNGLFAAYAVDSLAHPLPGNFVYNRP